jgi:hypothetical protein
MRDGVWTHGSDTALQAWIAGASRTIVVTREAIEDHLALAPQQAAEMTAAQRCEFVTDHLAQVIAAADRKAVRSDHPADPVMIRTGEL